MNEVNEKNSKFDLKRMFSIFFMLLLLYSCSTKFVTIIVDNEIWLDKYMYEVLGVQLTVVFAIIYVYSVFSKKKKVSYAAIVLLIISFLYSAYTYYSVETVVSGMGKAVEAFIKNSTTYGEGVIFYLISYLLLIIDIFLPEENRLNEVNKKTMDDEISNTQDIKDSYILANYIFGVDKRPDLYKALSAIIADDTSGTLNINIDINSEKPEVVSIPKKDIKGITHKIGIISKETMTTSSYGSAEKIRNIALFGVSIGPIVSINEDRIKDYYKVENTVIYDINIIYNVNGEEKRIMFQTRENPSDFIKKLNLDSL